MSLDCNQKLCRMLLGFLLIAMTLKLLVAGSVSPSKFRVFVAILTMVNMTWVANLASSSGVSFPLGSCVQLRGSVCTHCSRKNQSHTVSFPNFQEDGSTFRESLENLGCSRSAEKHVCIELATEAREGFDTQDKAELSAWSRSHNRSAHC